jgi:hypothetical protein
MSAIRQVSWPDLEALLEFLRRLLRVILVWSFDSHDVVIVLFRSGDAEVRPVERRDGNLRQAFESGGPENQSHRVGAAAKMAPQFWAPSQHCSSYPLCAGICRPSSRRVTCPSPARRPRSVWSGAELYQLAIGNLWSRLCQESQRVIRLNPVRFLSVSPAGSSTTFRLKTGKHDRAMKCPLEPAHSSSYRKNYFVPFLGSASAPNA